MPDFSEIIKKLNKANDIAIYCHTNPDGDALGSMLALYYALKKKGKNVVAYCDAKLSKHYQTFLGAENVQIPDDTKHELGVSVDTSSIEMLGGSIKSFLSCKSQISIDHHKSFKRWTDTAYVDKDACACSQIIYQLLKEMRLIDKTVAELLFSGIVTDSGCFAYSSVDSETHKIAADLMTYDFDASNAIYKTFRSTSVERFNLKRKVLAKAKFYCDNKVGIIVFNSADFADTNTTLHDTEGIVNEIIDIDSVKVAYALSEVGDKNYKVSIRTKDPVDASEIAGVYGGGGHRNASGCRANGYLEDIIDRLVKLAGDKI